MKLIVGLGNIGRKYSETRHNIGFMILDKLVGQQGWPNFEDNPKFKALISQIPESAMGEKLILAKPTTMMNLSGQAIGELARFYKLDDSEVWVIYDDIDVNFGLLKVRSGGGSAGHNGIKSIIEAIGPDFLRFRVGIRNSDCIKTPTDKFVLDKFNNEEQANLSQIISTTSAIIFEYLKVSGISPQTYNLKEPNSET